MTSALLTPPPFQGDCTGMDTDLFFTLWPDERPDLNEHQLRLLNRSRTAEAKAVCGGCPVRLSCLEWQLKYETVNGETVPGVYGGMSPTERFQLRRRQAA